jgi:hypothetical protein
MHEQIFWKLHMHLNMGHIHSLLYRSEYKGYGIQCEIHTHMKKNQRPGKSKFYYFIDGDPREFKSEEELIKAIDEEK